MAVNFKRKVLVFDEYDAIAADAGLQTELVSFLRKKPAVPVVLLSKPSRSSKAAEFAKGLPAFALRPAPAPEVEAFLARVAAAELSPERCAAVDIPDLVRRSRGDLRAAVSELAMRLGSKDEFAEGLDALEAVVR